MPFKHRTLSDQPGLEGVVNKSLVRYVENFYEIIDNSSGVKLKIFDRCQRG